MKTCLKKLFLIAISVPLLSCTLAMPEAVAPSNPPKINKSSFEKSSLFGCYQHEIKKEINSPKMFLWPVEKIDEISGDSVPLSLDEQSNVRQKIVSLADEIEELGIQRRSEEQRISKLFDSGIEELELKFTENKCYSFCDPNDFLCDPNDSSILQVDTWKQSQDPVEIQTIVDCKNNQEQRDIIKSEKSKEISEKVEPLRKKEGASSLSFLQVVGDKNFFPALSKFEFQYKEMKGEASNDEDQSKVIIKIIYNEIEFTNISKAKNLIREVSLDTTNGYLTFKMDYIDLENDNKQVGEFFFDLELNPNGSTFKVEGDVRLSYLSGEKERVGRFSSAGRIVGLPESGQECEK